jgi:hypothetical protein
LVGFIVMLSRVTYIICTFEVAQPSGHTMPSQHTTAA